MNWKSLHPLLCSTAGVIHSSYSDALNLPSFKHGSGSPPLKPHPRLLLGLWFPKTQLTEKEAGMWLAVPCLGCHKEREKWWHCVAARELCHNTGHHVWRNHDVKCVSWLMPACTISWVPYAMENHMLLQMFAAKWLDHTPAVPTTEGKDSWKI